MKRFARWFFAQLADALRDSSPLPFSLLPVKLDLGEREKADLERFLNGATWKTIQKIMDAQARAYVSGAVATGVSSEAVAAYLQALRELPQKMWRISGMDKSRTTGVSSHEGGVITH